MQRGPYRMHVNTHRSAALFLVEGQDGAWRKSRLGMPKGVSSAVQTSLGWCDVFVWFFFVRGVVGGARCVRGLLSMLSSRIEGP